jgi:hypothetical protein
LAVEGPGLLEARECVLVRRWRRVVVVHRVSSDFVFCEGEVGSDDFSEFLAGIPEIDVVYAAPPKREYMPMWYGLAGRRKLAHEAFMSGFFGILRAVDAPEHHIEVGASNGAAVRAFFASWRKFPHCYERELYYSAPLHARTDGVARCRHPTRVLAYSDHPVPVPPGKYSHEYLDGLLAGREKLRVFDPVLGKGLLARIAFRHGHACCGIEMNPKRLQVAVACMEGKCSGGA